MSKVVISLSDGISCGKVALDDLGVKGFDYYASEIDKDAIYISEQNHNNIIRIGDVLGLEQLPFTQYKNNRQQIIKKDIFDEFVGDGE